MAELGRFWLLLLKLLLLLGLLALGLFLMLLVVERERERESAHRWTKSTYTEAEITETKWWEQCPTYIQSEREGERGTGAEREDHLCDK